MESFDIKTAFLTGSSYLPIHTIQVRGFKEGTSDIISLRQSVYGTRKAHRHFKAKLKENFFKVNLHSTETDNSLYSHWKGNSFLHVHMHVDDGLVFSNNKELVTEMKTKIMDIYTMKWHVEPTEHLRIKITDQIAQDSYLNTKIYPTSCIGSTCKTPTLSQRH